jgi:hypothetical protein
VQRFFEDLDEVGQGFVNSVATPRAMADLLANLDEYPRRISWGGASNCRNTRHAA